MTAPYRRISTCKVCGNKFVLEDDVNQWFRDHPQLKSTVIAVSDIDLIFHRHHGSYDRFKQCFGLVEVKTRGAKPSVTQRDTLNMVGQLLRNRRQTPHKKRNFSQAINPPDDLYSTFHDRRVPYVACGYHLLSLDGATPDSSDEIRWDQHFINKETLIRILRFELDPDSLEPFDFRIHHVRHPEFTFRTA